MKEINGSITELNEYRSKQTGWVADSTKRGKRVDLSERARKIGDKFYDKLFGAIDSALHPIDTLRDSSRKTKITLAATASLLATGVAGNYISHTPQIETPQGVNELHEIAKNPDDLFGIEEARVNMYLSGLGYLFSESGEEQLHRSALQDDDRPLFGQQRESYENTQRGLDALIVVSQMIEAHDLGEGRFLEFDDVSQQQLKERLGDFVNSGLASDDIKELHERGDFNEILRQLHELPGDLATAHATLGGEKITKIDTPDNGIGGR